MLVRNSYKLNNVTQYNFDYVLGVIGLTTALELIKNGYNVTVIAEYFPNNTQNIHYCSPKAGGHHVSFTKKGTKHFS